MMKLKGLFTVLVILLLTASCGKYIEKSTIDSKIADEEVSLIFDTTLQNVNFSLPMIQLPVYDFKNQQNVGKLKLNDKRIVLELNMSKIINEGISTKCTLPNGNPLPIIFDGTQQIFCFETKDQRATVYVALEKNLAIAGVAIPIKTLESNEVQEPFELFSSVDMGEVKGTVGTFLGNGEGQSGAAIFMNFSSWLPLIEQVGNATPDTVDLIFNNFVAQISGQTPTIKMPSNVTSLTFRQYQIMKELKRKAGMYY